jgi:nicotinate phosphoribosyltransferase
MAVTDAELQWLKGMCPYFKQPYLEYLSTYKFKPEQVHISFIPVSGDGELGHVDIEAVGPWYETILWEVPLMALLSEIYFRLVTTDWIDEGQAGMFILSVVSLFLTSCCSETAYKKGLALLEAGCTFSEFGTRRRRSYYTQDVVVQSLLRASNDMPDKGKVAGTSNVIGLAPCSNSKLTF